MIFGNNEADETYLRWLPDYKKRASNVEKSVANIFAMALKEAPAGSLFKDEDINKSLQYLQKQQDTFPEKIIFFLYSSRYDENFSEELIDPEKVRSALPDDLTAKEIFDRKSEKLDKCFKAFVLSVDTFVNHYTLALMRQNEGFELPLVWDVPVKDEKETGYPADAMWWLNFKFACEFSVAIVGFGGFTNHFVDELTYIRNRSELMKKFVWMDQDLNLFFPDNPDQQWSISDIALILEKIKS